MVADEQSGNPRMTPEPPLLRPPGTRLDRNSSTEFRRYGFWVALLFLLVIALAVVFYLPQVSLTDTREPASPAASLSESAAPADISTEDTAARTAAEMLLREFLRLRARLELDNAPIWGQPEWNQVTAEVNQGDRLFLQNDFAAAGEAYQRSIDLLIDLESGRAERLAKVLEQGQHALANDDAKSAISSFEHALAIEPDNQLATVGLERAHVRGDVIKLMQDGREAEQQADLETALTAYARASTLDGDYTQATESVLRVTARIDRDRFQGAMSDAIRALDAQQFSEADKALDIAAQLQPEDVSVRNLRQRLVVERKRSAIASLRTQAQHQVAAEDWQAASRSYAKVLAIDPNVAFATDGNHLARQRIRLHQQIDHYLAEPTRLYSDEPLTNAEQLLAAAGRAPAGEPRLASKIATLRRHIIDAQTPLTVELRSDGLTDVMIYHVGHPGRFMQQQIELRPGTYTLLGSRPGYRDVRKQIEVRPSVTPAVVTIRCEEMI